VQVTSGDYRYDEDSQPTWSPDGRSIAFRRTWWGEGGTTDNVWLATGLPDFTTPVAPAMWSQVKTRFH